jgi:Group II intron, maturase-specific domain
MKGQSPNANLAAGNSEEGSKPTEVLVSQPLWDANDFVSAFEDQGDAEGFYRVLGQRLGKFELELSREKSRVIPFSRHRHAEKTSFEFLGFEFRWGKDRGGQDHLKRRTSRTKLRSALKRFMAWCKEHRHLQLKVLFERLKCKLRGYYNYYRVYGNFASLKAFFDRAIRILRKWLNRRSQRRSYTWVSSRATLALCHRTTTDRGATPEAGGHFAGLSRLAAASISEEPGAAKLHAGICAGDEENSMEKQKALVDFTDKELCDALRSSVENVVYSPANYREEMFRGSQDRNTKALNRWSAVIALATLINAIASTLLLFRGMDWF